MRVAIQGAGTSPFGKQPELRPADLVNVAVREALETAGDGPPVEAVYFGSVYGEMGVAQRCLHLFGIHDVPVVRVENACASGSTAFHEAVASVAAGRYERALVVGVEHMTSRFRGAIPPDMNDPHGRSGLLLPSLYALAATRYVEAHGLTLEDLAQVSVKNHAHAMANPRAGFAADLTVEQVLASRMISSPLTLLQCSPISDGAAALVVGRERAGSHDVPVRSSAMASGSTWDHRDDSAWGVGLVRRVAQAAYEQAGAAPSDIDVVECHDAFTIGEIMVTESLGLAGEGLGGELVANGATCLGGSLPVNPSGGLLSRGHPLGATGVAQLAEVTWQLQGRARGRQVEGAQMGLVETMGGGVSGIDGNACVVAVLGG